MNDDMNAENTTTVVSDSVQDNWIELTDAQFTCGECENTSNPETNTAEGTVKADLDSVLEDLKQFPSKEIYGTCPVCGMEYLFKVSGEKLYLEPVDLEK